MTREEIKRLATLADSMIQDASLIFLLCDQEVLTSQHRDCAKKMKDIAQNIMDIHNTLDYTKPRSSWQGPQGGKMSIRYLHTIRGLHSHVFVCECGRVWEFSWLNDPGNFPDPWRACDCGTQYLGETFSKALRESGGLRFVDAPEYDD